MAQILSNQMAKLYAQPSEKLENGEGPGYRNRHVTALVPVTVADLVAGNTIRLQTLPNNAVPYRIYLRNDALDTASALTYDLGTAYSGLNGAIINPTLYVSGGTQLQTANKAGVDVTFANRPLSSCLNTIEEDSGLVDITPSSQGTMYGMLDIVMTIVNAGTPAAGNLVLELSYTEY